MRLLRERRYRGGLRSGGALILALVTISIVATLGAAYLQMVLSQSTRQSAESATLKAFYLAEAGLAESFHDVRMGRNGQIGSILRPARFGDGLVWVDASQTKDDQIRLVATGMWGSGLATLSYVMEPTELTLGIFSDQGMEIDQVLMIDGYDSGVGRYETQLAEEQTLPAGMSAIIEDFLFMPRSDGSGANGCYLGYHDGCVGDLSHDTLYSQLIADGEGSQGTGVVGGGALVPREGGEKSHQSGGSGEKSHQSGGGGEKSHQSGGGGGGSHQSGGSGEKSHQSGGSGGEPQISTGDLGGDLTTMPTPIDEPIITFEDFMAVRNQGQELLINSLREQCDQLYETYADEALASGLPDGESLYPRPGIGLHMAEGGLLASNGDIHFDPRNSELQEIYGDINTGPMGTLAGEEGIVLSGDYSPSGLSIDLPEVQVPDIPMQAAVRQDGVLPMMIPSGLSGLDHVEVAADSELIIQGPATVVLGGLILEPGALLTLDTRGGDIALYVTGCMDLQPGSETITTGDTPSELSLQVAPIEAFPGETPIKLESTSQFKGTVFSPGTDVYVGSDFEVFGGVVAKKITFGAGSRLHVDRANYGGSPVPKLISWRILELPAGSDSVNINPYTFVGLDSSDALKLSAASDLRQVVMDLEYVDLSGNVRSFAGYESEFNWDTVGSIVHVRRDTFREAEAGATPKTITDGTGVEITQSVGARESITDIAEWADSASGHYKCKNEIKKAPAWKAPFTTEDWVVIKSINALGNKELDKLSKEDIKMGGPGK